MKLKTLAVLFALVIVLSMAAGVFADADFAETWDENTVLTVFNDLDMYFPDMFADEDSDFLWVDNGPADFPGEFPKVEGKSADVIAKAPIANDPESKMEASYDPCGDGLIKYDVTIYKAKHDPNNPGYADATGMNMYYGDRNTTYIRDINAFLTVTDPDSGSSSSFKLGVKTCESTGGDDCKSVTFKKKGDAYEAHLKGYLTVPAGMIMYDPELNVDYQLDMYIDFSAYMTALWPVDEGSVSVSAFTEDGSLKANDKKDYCQESLRLYDAFGHDKSYDKSEIIDPIFFDAYGHKYHSLRGKYDENTGEARLQVIVANYQPDVRRQNYVIPAEVYAFTDVTPDTYVSSYASLYGPYSVDYMKFENAQRITDYTCKYTIFNVANAAPRTDYCKFGEGIAIPDHGLVRIDITIDALSGDILREANGGEVPFALRLGGYMGGADVDETGAPGIYTQIVGFFEPVDFPCPPVSRMQVLDPIKPFMSFYNVLKSDGAIKPSGAYGAYEGGVWGMYQKCGKLAYMMVRLKNDGINDEVVDLNHTAVAINGGTPMKWNWIMTTMEPEKGSKIVLEGGEEVTLIGRAKLTDVPSQLNADTAMTGAVNFTDFGFYITGKVYSDHNNTRCAAAPK